MRLSSSCVLTFLLCCVVIISTTTSDLILLPSKSSLPRSPARNLLSLETQDSSRNANTSLVATEDGAIHLVETESKRVIWSFQSGPSIYSSYHRLVDSDTPEATSISDGYYIDVGDDWDLYIHAKDHGKLKLQWTIEDFIRSTPQILEDGSVILGSRKTTVFEVEARTGKLIHAYNFSDTPSNATNTTTSKSMEADSVGSEATEPRLHITRTDYSLQSFAPSSNKVLWNITVADIGVVLICQNYKNLPGGPPLTSKYDVISDFGEDFSLPLQCQSRAVVYRYRDRNMLGSSSGGSRLPLASRQDSLRLMLASGELSPLQPNDHEANQMLPVSAQRQLLSKVDGRPVDPASRLKIHKSRKLNVLGVVSFILFFAVIMTYVVHQYVLRKGETKMSDLSGNENSKSSSKRKKNRRSGKKENQDSSSLEDGHIDNTMWLDLNKRVHGSADGHQIGKLFVLNSEIAKGSNGTIVLEGIYEGRPVAVKRLVRAHHDVAFKEIQHLIASDRHPNIVRWYGVEYDKDFVYLSLERCCCSLDDLIHLYSDQSKFLTEEQAKGIVIECKNRLESAKKTFGDLNLWKPNGSPAPLLLKLMRDVVSGLVHLHELGIVHRDLKPQNVLIIKETSLCAKLSDMGISKRLTGDMSSLGHHVTGSGSSGWQAPEQLLQGRQTRSVDMFSLGCVLFYCITGGRHPFGIHLERDINIVRNDMDLFLVDHIPEAMDLFTQLLSPDPLMRPKALDVLHHPVFWSYERRLSFLRDTSDRVELEDREAGSILLKALEGIAPVALGGKWDEKMELAFIINIGRYRRYKYDSVRDLLRVMRNKLNHYRELPKEIQELLGSVPDGFYEYFSARFPNLLIEVYKVICGYCKEEECFNKYFRSDEV